VSHRHARGLGRRSPLAHRKRELDVRDRDRRLQHRHRPHERRLPALLDHGAELHGGRAPTPHERLDRLLDPGPGHRQLERQRRAAGDLGLEPTHRPSGGGGVELGGERADVGAPQGQMGEQLDQDVVSGRGAGRREDRAVDDVGVLVELHLEREEAQPARPGRDCRGASGQPRERVGEPSSSAHRARGSGRG
jgi:hypothetical protein